MKKSYKEVRYESVSFFGVHLANCLCGEVPIWGWEKAKGKSGIDICRISVGA